MYLPFLASIALALHPAAHGAQISAVAHKPQAGAQSQQLQHETQQLQHANALRLTITQPATPQPRAARCTRTFTVQMAIRAIDATYGAGLPASPAQIMQLQRYIRCQRNPAAQAYLRQLWTRSKPAPLQGPAIASWYYDGGGTGCGFHATHGIATLIAPCGSRFQLCNGATCVVATRDDSGPYVVGPHVRSRPGHARRALLRRPLHSALADAAMSVR